MRAEEHGWRRNWRKQASPARARSVICGRMKIGQKRGSVFAPEILYGMALGCIECRASERRNDSESARSGDVYLFTLHQQRRDGLHLAWSRDGLKWMR